MAKAARIAAAAITAGGANEAFYRGKIATARFFSDSHLAGADGLRHAAMAGNETLDSLSDDQF